MVAKVEKIVTPCETCGTSVALHASKRKRGRGRFCSKTCAGAHRVTVMNAVRRPPKEYARPPVRTGPANNKYVAPVTVTCEACGTSFERKPHRIGGPEFRGRYCSKSCRDSYRRTHESGLNSPFWVGGPKTYRGRGWKAIRLVVVREQCGHCAHCDKYVGFSLPVNHIRPFREFATPEEANQRANLLGLCQPCHMRAEPRRRRHAAPPSRSVSKSS